MLRKPVCGLRKSVYGLILGLSLSSATLADEWPQWMGPNRDGLWKETGIIDSIPESGLPVLWRVPIGGGYSGPSVAQGCVVVTDYQAVSPEVNNDPSTRDRREGKERIVCLDFKTGAELWKVEYPRPYSVSYAVGPRATPTIDGDLVYCLGAEGDLLCLKLKTGQEVWKMNLSEVYKTETPIWGHSAHPLIKGDLLYCLAGGKDHLVVALDKRTGKEVWGALNAEEIGYCPPSIASINGVEQLVVWTPDTVAGLDLKTGKTNWSYPLVPNYAMSISAPRFQGNKFFASGIGEVAAMVELDKSGKPGKTLWSGGDMKRGVYSANATPLWIGDVIYGADCGSGKFIAVDAASGKRLWETYQLTAGGERRASHGTAFMVQNDWRSFIFAETGDLILAKLSKNGFEEKGRMKVVEPTGECFGRAVVWSHPAFANRCVVIRNDKEIVCVSLAAK
ncbi:MAG: PQQ-binding-like beta-propeller repeat protein [Pirellula sp.]|jgi:outer membrane protein assembly factor BamB